MYYATFLLVRHSRKPELIRRGERDQLPSPNSKDCRADLIRREELRRAEVAAEMNMKLASDTDLGDDDNVAFSPSPPPKRRRLTRCKPITKHRPALREFPTRAQRDATDTDSEVLIQLQSPSASPSVYGTSAAIAILSKTRDSLEHQVDRTCNSFLAALQHVKTVELQSARARKAGRMDDVREYTEIMDDILDGFNHVEATAALARVQSKARRTAAALAILEEDRDEGAFGALQQQRKPAESIAVLAQRVVDCEPAAEED